MVTFYILTIVFGLYSANIIMKYIWSSISPIENVIFMIAITIFSIGVGVITAGSWLNFVTFFTG